MLFNSYIFILVFLPVVFMGFYAFGRVSHVSSCAWLAVASLFFYGWWDIKYVWLLLTSIAFNYLAGYAISRSVSNGARLRSRVLLLGAITANLCALGYFKYFKFFAGNANLLAGTSWEVAEIVLPLGISFFTFTQIAFLVDAYQAKVKEYNPVLYLLFVTYFPHLIAGPVLHHNEMMPQFASRTVCRINWDNVAVGIAIFALGLSKKILIADTFAEYATPVFSAVEQGGAPLLFEAWLGALSYTMQLYFDFSAYCDMAIGLSLMFNVRLPINFDSPYKAVSIIEFWRRWHMTLSRFLRDYLYVPLGGNRDGTFRRYLNLMVTMLLGGLWHGAGWTFVIWGALHGFYLVLNHGWRAFKRRLNLSEGGFFARMGAGALTFIAVVVGWVFFRADSVPSAAAFLKGMVGLNGVSFPASAQPMLGLYFTGNSSVAFQGLHTLTTIRSSGALAMLGLGFIMVWGLPNVRQMFRLYRPVCEDLEPHPPKSVSGPALLHLVWKPTPARACALGVLLAMGILGLTRVSEFLYFQF